MQITAVNVLLTMLHLGMHGCFEHATSCTESTVHTAGHAQKHMRSCRCYEIQCLTGVVVGNYTTTGATPESVPYNTSTGFIEPGLDYDTLADDYGRYWNGNPLMSEDMLFTQCWNVSQVTCTLRHQHYPGHHHG